MAIQKLIKVGYLISYDYEYIFTSLKYVYAEADIIVLCYDKNFKTWSGNNFFIPQSFFDKIIKIDTANKIKLYADDFFVEENINYPIKSEVRQRNMLSIFMGKGGWHLHIDSDEYPYNFGEITNYLRRLAFMTKNPEKSPINIIAKWIVLFKKDDFGFYLISPVKENFYLATNLPNYTLGRRTEATCELTNFYYVHQSWARDEAEVKQKLDNWGHKNDFDTQTYFNAWKAIDNLNYKEVKNFHPINATEWENLEFIEAKNIEECINKLAVQYPQPNYKQLLKKFKIPRSIKHPLRTWYKIKLKL
jgi:hypothetical protein